MTGIEEIRRELRELAEPGYQQFQAALIPGVTGLLGVRRPALRKLAAGILKEDPKAFLKAAGRDSFEEILLCGLVIGGLSEKQADTEELLSLVRGYVREITDWAVCDGFCGALKRAAKEREAFWEFIFPYLSSENEFGARFGAVMLLEHFICDEWLDGTLHGLFLVKQEGYYAQMAVAWAYSICFIRFPKETEKFLAEHPLPDFTRRKTISKIRDSFRVPKEEKDRLKKYGFGGGL